METEISRIIIDTERFRPLDEDFLAELIESIRLNGLIQPVVIDDEQRLLAGRHRLEACKRLGWLNIPFRMFSDLDIIERKIIEFEENDRRKQLTWQERAAAIKEIHDLKVSREGPKWSASDTARELGLSIGKVSEDLTLATALDNPRVAGRPSRRGALTTVKREREIAIVREIARRRAVDIGLAPNTASETLTSGVIYNADCRSILEDMKEDSVDLIIIDPPWGIDFANASQWTKKWLATYDDSPNEVRSMLVQVMPLLFRVLKPGNHIYTFFPIQEIQWWVDLLTQVGFIVRQRPLVWYKSGQPSISDVYTSFLPCYEEILWGYKAAPARRLFSRPIPEAQAFPRQPGTYHENEKPVEMLERWIETSSEPNEVVLDCFAGGGSTLAAAYSLGRYYIGVELDEVHYRKCVERMRALEEQAENVDAES